MACIGQPTCGCSWPRVLVLSNTSKRATNRRPQGLWGLVGWMVPRRGTYDLSLGPARTFVFAILGSGPPVRCCLLLDWVLTPDLPPGMHTRCRSSSGTNPRHHSRPCLDSCALAQWGFHFGRVGSRPLSLPVAHCHPPRPTPQPLHSPQHLGLEWKMRKTRGVERSGVTRTKARTRFLSRTIRRLSSRPLS